MTPGDFLEEEFWWLSQLGLPIQGFVGVAHSKWSPPTEDSHFQLIDHRLNVEQLGDWAQRHSLRSIEYACCQGEVFRRSLVANFSV